MTRYMLAHFGQGITHGPIGVEGVVMLSGIPLLEGGKALRHCGEQPHNNLHRRAFHFTTETVD